MPAAEALVYLIHGEDDLAISETVARLEKQVGDDSFASMNLVRLDGKNYDPAGLIGAVSAMPFLGNKRVVVLSPLPLARLKDKTARQRFTAILSNVPPSTRLALVEHGLLKSDDRKKPHWLIEWAASAGPKVKIEEHNPPKGSALVEWIIKRVQAAGGRIDREAARDLAGLCDEDTGVIAQELNKLLAYVNYARSIELIDVRETVADSNPGDTFELVDALGSRNEKRALELIRRQMEYEEPAIVFGLVVRQFRLLIITREYLDNGGGLDDLIGMLHLPRFVVEKNIEQARRFTLPTLERIFRRLLEVDEEVKTSQMTVDLALETLAAALGSGGVVGVK
jgi:DNA polymerase-3 subunit delta